MAIGQFAHIGLAKETAWGTPVAATAYFPFESESLTLEIEQLMPQEIRTYLDEPPQFEGLNTVAGDIVFEARPATIGHFLRSALGAPTTTGTNPYTHVFLPAASSFSANAALPSYTFEVQRDVGANAFQYAGCIVNELQIECGVGQKVMKATASILGKTVAMVAKTTPSLDATTPFFWKNGTVTIGGSANTNLESFSIRISNNLQAVPLLNGSKEVAKITWDGFRVVTINLVFDITDTAEYTRFIGQGETTCTIDFSPDANTQLKFETNKLRYEAFPFNIGGPGRQTVQVTGKCKYDATLGGAIKVTLKNSVASY